MPLINLKVSSQIKVCLRIIPCQVISLSLKIIGQVDIGVPRVDFLEQNILWRKLNFWRV